MFRPGINLSKTAQNTDESVSDSPGPGQPRPMEGARQPTGAERVRTLVESNTSVSLTLPGADTEGVGWGAPVASTVTPDGDVILLVPGDSLSARAAAHAQDDDLAAVLELTDVAPVAMPHRIRGRAWVSGWLTPLRNGERAAGAMLLAERHPAGEILGIAEPSGPAWMMLRLEIGEITVDDLWGMETVDPDDFAVALCDPLAQHEAELLQHLDSSHSDQVYGLRALLGERQTCAEGATAVPVALDRFGLRVRFGGGRHGGHHCFDARFEFPEPVRDVTELRRAMHALFEAAG